MRPLTSRICTSPSNLDTRVESLHRFVLQSLFLLATILFCVKSTFLSSTSASLSHSSIVGAFPSFSADDTVVVDRCWKSFLRSIRFFISLSNSSRFFWNLTVFWVPENMQKQQYGIVSPTAEAQMEITISMAGEKLSQETTCADHTGAF